MELYSYSNRAFAKECLHEEFENPHASESFPAVILTESSDGDSNRILQVPGSTHSLSIQQ